MPREKPPGSLTLLHGRVCLRGGVLGRRQEINAFRGLVHGWRMLEAAGAIENFVLAAGDGMPPWSCCRRNRRIPT